MTGLGLGKFLSMIGMCLSILLTIAISIVEIGHSPDTLSISQVPESLSLRQNTPKDIAKPVRPVEFRLWVAFPFVNLFIVLAVLLGVIYMKAYANGMSIALTCSLLIHLMLVWE